VLPEGEPARPGAAGSSSGLQPIRSIKGYSSAVSTARTAAKSAGPNIPASDAPGVNGPFVGFLSSGHPYPGRAE
jgi:hypothetical protein